MLKGLEDSTDQSDSAESVTHHPHTAALPARIDSGARRARVPHLHSARSILTLIIALQRVFLSHSYNNSRPAAGICRGNMIFCRTVAMRPT